METTRDLAGAIAQRLRPLGFGPLSPQAAGEEGLAAVLHRPRGSAGPRLFCAVVHLNGQRAAQDALDAAQRIRHALARQHKRFFPWPGQMGTFLVLVGGQEIFENLRASLGGLLDTHGRHVNVLLGAVLVDRSGFQSVSDNIFGLLRTDGEFALIQGAVEGWCRAHRHRNGHYAKSPSVLNLA